MLSTMLTIHHDTSAQNSIIQALKRKRSSGPEMATSISHIKRKEHAPKQCAEFATIFLMLFCK